MKNMIKKLMTILALAFAGTALAAVLI